MTTKIKVSDLDFDLIKANLKEFLQSQPEFTDHNFDGSGLSVLLDVLAYNTHYNALYTNLAINEMFLDSASKRDSIVSIANNYGYLPISRKSARAEISMIVDAGTSTDSTLSIPKYTPFTSTVGNEQFNFYTLSESIGVRSLDGEFVFDSISLCEGIPVIEKFTAISGTKYVLQNSNIDTSTIKVYVQLTSETLNSVTYTFSENMVGLSETDPVFFVKETQDFKYEIYFGKNNLGLEPSDGSVITIEYMISSGESANGLSLFTYNGTQLTGTPVISVISQATGGRELETNDEIKFNVSRKFRLQDRAVTSADYSDIIKSNYQDIDAINCWGGDEQDPPIYGKVFISIKPKSGLFLTPNQKVFIIENLIRPKSVIGITPEIIDPTYNKIEMEVTVRYDPSKTNKSQAQIKELVRQTIVDYNDVDLQKFDGILRLSRLQRNIDDADTSIIDNTTVIKMRRAVDVIYNRAVRYAIEMNNEIAQAGVPEQ